MYEPVRSNTMTVLVFGLVLTALGCRSQPEFANANTAANVGLVDIGGYSLWLNCEGAGNPTVVLDGGAGTWSTHYLPVQRRLNATTRTCTYDRAGLGQSDVGPMPRTSSRMANELHRLLREAGESPPFVLVGHSLGGYNVRIFQNRFPDEVAAIVLVDAGHPDQWDVLPSALRDLVVGAPPVLRQMADMAAAGALKRDVVERQVSPAFPDDVRERLIDAGLAAKSYVGRAAEFESGLHSGAEVPDTNLGSLPLVVLTARNSAYAYDGMGVPTEEANTAWLELQAELAELSSQSMQVFSDGTHALNETHPDDIVDAVRAALEMLPPAGR